MKKIITSMALTIFTLTTYAQGYAGGGMTFWYNDKDNRTTIAFTPEIGYRASKRFAFGVSLGYRHNKEKETRSDVYSVAPYIRHYLYSLNELDLLWDGIIEYSYTDTRNNGHGNTIGIGVKPGISYTINKHFCITAHIGFIGYRHCDRKAITEENTPGLGLRLYNELNFTFHYHF